MNQLAYGMCKILNWILNPIILLLALYELSLFVGSLITLRGMRKEIDEINDNSSKETHLSQKGPGYVRTEARVITEIDWNRFDSFCDRYQQKGKLFSRYSMIIQLFPLLGILGTVAGLYIAMNGNQDWTNAQGMFDGVRFALSSTIWGIIAAVFAKVGDVILTSGFLNYIDDGIERFKDKYNEAKGLPLGGDNR